MSGAVLVSSKALSVGDEGGGAMSVGGGGMSAGEEGGEVVSVGEEGGRGQEWPAGRVHV